MADSCEHGNKPSVSVKGREIFDQLSNCCLPKKDCSMEFGRYLDPQQGEGVTQYRNNTTGPLAHPAAEHPMICIKLDSC
jgi:hypothetical protein